MRLPDVEKLVFHRLQVGDTVALLAFVAAHRARTEASLGAPITVASCFEAGPDGFWLHRFLVANGIDNVIVEPTSILISRRSRRAKTDRLDAQGLLRVLMARHRGDHQICSVLRVPTPEEEDAKRPHRERERLVQERVRIENRIKFQDHAVDDNGAVLVRRQVRRAQVVLFFSRVSPCLIGMEACAGAHHWARKLAKLGHEVRLIPPSYVKPFINRGKTDAADAGAICEAVTRPNMRFVPVKTERQQAVMMQHWVRDFLVRQLTQLANAIQQAKKKPLVRQ